MKIGKSKADELRTVCYSTLIDKIHFHSMKKKITLPLWQELDEMIWNDMIAKAQFVGDAIESSNYLEKWN